MEDRTVENLPRFSRPRAFQAGEYICREGLPGSEMFIIVQGSVSVTTMNLLDDTLEIERIQPGGFFGEMALFDDKPSNISCIAMEETVCIAIPRSKLREFILSCPDVAETLLLNFSGRIRKMNDMLYKAARSTEGVRCRPFSLPEEHGSYSLREKGADRSRYLTAVSALCPLCQRRITVQYINFKAMRDPVVLPSQRRVYEELDVLWHYILSCPECGYSNDYLHFFNLQGFSHGELMRIVADEWQYYKRRYRAQSPLDTVMFQYYSAIHFCTCAGEDPLRCGKLWLYLSWLYGDTLDERMSDLCREKALGYYRIGYDKSRQLLKSDNAKQQCAIVVAELFLATGNWALAKSYYYESVQYPDKKLKKMAYDRIKELREKEKQFSGHE